MLGDYYNSSPEARDAEVLSVYACLIDVLRGKAEAHVQNILKYTFETTLGMITHDMAQYPEVRLKFFALLRAVNQACFSVFATMSADQMKLVIDSIIWAIRHTERNVADTGLHLLFELLRNLESSPGVSAFHQTYFTLILQEIISVLTDTVHKPGFKMHCYILHHLFQLCQNGSLTAPLAAPPAAGSGSGSVMENKAFVVAFTSDLLQRAFPNLAEGQIRATVDGFLSFPDTSTFKRHVRDFLVQSKQFSDKENQQLFEEEVEKQKAEQKEQLAKIGGMVNPYEISDDMDD